MKKALYDALKSQLDRLSHYLDMWKDVCDLEGLTSREFAETPAGKVTKGMIRSVQDLLEKARRELESGE